MIKKWYFVEVGIKKYFMIIAKAGINFCKHRWSLYWAVRFYLSYS